MLLAIATLAAAPAAYAAEAAPIEAAPPPSDKGDRLDVPERSWAVFGQITNVTQRNNHFHSPYSGANSLKADGRTEETTDVTVYAGLRVWRGGEIWVNPEVDQGFGLSGTLGVAGFPSGEAYKIGANATYLRLPRMFLRQYVPLGGATEHVEGVANQFAYESVADSVALTVGKFSVVDIFDANRYAHDPRGDFMNWALVDAGTFDYAADGWGFTYGAAAELALGPWSVRGGIFQLSPAPNGKITAVDFSQYSWVAELERRYEWSGLPGKARILGFLNRGKMGAYDDAVQRANEIGGTPSTAAVRQVRSRPGVSLDMEQGLSPGIGMFARAGSNNGRFEAYEFTEINTTASAGLSVAGSRWGRPDDKLGIAAVANALSADARRYFAAGGLGILIGDGRLNYGGERIVELYYSLKVNSHVTLAVDYQHLQNPAYNHDRGPVSVFGARLHAEL